VLAASDDGLLEAKRLLDGPAWAGDQPDHCRCRFLLAHVLERLGEPDQARRAAQSLLPFADAAQRERLDRLLARLPVRRDSGQAQQPGEPERGP
jgi:hypothetical protein